MDSLSPAPCGIVALLSNSGKAPTVQIVAILVRRTFLFSETCFVFPSVVQSCSKKRDITVGCCII